MSKAGAVRICKKAWNDFCRAFSWSLPILIPIVGGILMLVGEATLSLTEESPREIVALTVRQMAPDASAKTSEPDRGWATPSKMSVIRFLANFVGVKLGELLLVGWFLHTFLHSAHYAEFFLNQIEKAMSGERFAASWSQSPTLWKKVSEVYFSKRFPQIQNALTDTLYAYFPTEHEYYLKDYVLRITLELKDDYLHSEEEISYTCVPKSGGTEVPFKYYNAIYRTGEDDNRTWAKVTGISIDRDQLEGDFSYKKGSLDGRPIISLNVNHENIRDKEYIAAIRVKKAWSLAVDPYKTFTVTSLVHNMKVVVEYSDDLEVQWFDLGTLSKFADVFGQEPQRIEKQYAGLVFRKQGFRLSIKRKDA